MLVVVVIVRLETGNQKNVQKIAAPMMITPTGGESLAWSRATAPIMKSTISTNVNIR